MKRNQHTQNMTPGDQAGQSRGGYFGGRDQQGGQRDDRSNQGFGRGYDRDDIRAGGDDAWRGDSRGRSYGDDMGRAGMSPRARDDGWNETGSRDFGYGASSGNAAYGSDGGRRGYSTIDHGRDYERGGWPNFGTDDYSTDRSRMMGDDRGMSGRQDGERGYESYGSRNDAGFGAMGSQDDIAGRGPMGISGRMGKSGNMGASGYENQRPIGDRANEYGRRGEGAWGAQRSEEHFGKGPKGYKRTDERIKEDICECLSDANIDASEIEVEVQDGVAKLQGTVTDKFQKRMAEDLVEGRRGVKSVENHLRIQPSQGSSTSETSQGRGDRNNREERKQN
jgi:osmotically-inducible protein OsmY